MRYVFESGQYPNERVLDDRELPSDEAAVEHAARIGADYVWDAPADGVDGEGRIVDVGRNPASIWRRSRKG